MTPTLDSEILAGFLSEASGYLPAIRAGVARYRDTPADPAALEESHRYAHTISGAAAMVGLAGLSHIAHQLEATLEDLILGQLPPSEPTFDGLELGLAAIDTYLHDVADGTLENDALVRATVADLRTLRGLATDDNPAAAGDSRPPSGVGFDDFTSGAADRSGDETVCDDDLPVPVFSEFRSEPPDEMPRSDAPNELLEVFRLEAEVHLLVLTTVLSKARTGVVGRDEWRDVRRAAHTLKGAAAMVGFADVTSLAHRMEDLFDGYYESDRTPTSDEIERLLAASDAIDDVVNGRPAQLGPLLDRFAATPGPTPVPPPVAVAPRIEAPAITAAEAPHREAGGASVRVPLDRLAEIVKLVGELVISRTAFEQRMGDFRRLLGELEPTTVRLSRVSAKFETTHEVVGSTATRTTSPAAEADAFDALEFDRYTEFHALTRELAETASDIQTVDGELGHLLGDFGGHLTRQARLESELEDKLMWLRMVPFASTAARLQRTVRAAARESGKRVELVLVGERTGLDKSVLEALSDPLLHLLRNAIGHGLESPEVRTALGKSEAGTITVTARHEDSHVVLTLADDGRGIDPERVRASAVSREVMTAEAAAALSPADLFDLLFLPGFSTAPEVSE